MIFIFDLDGTLTLEETLPRIAKRFGLEDDLSTLTSATVRGDVPFVESFIRRFQILSALPVEDVSDTLAKTPLNDQLLDFIKNFSASCAIATGNYIGWINNLVDSINCEVYASEAQSNAQGHLVLTKILKKEDVVRRYKDLGETVVYIGDGHNDAEAMRLADIGIACGVVHSPANSVLQVCDYAVYDSTALVNLLRQIADPQDGQSVVISCAGTGTRLGMGQTKSLIKIAGAPLIEYQLNYFANEPDVRIVVGYQAADLIEVVLKIRPHAVFVFNHDYFHTKTGASLFLGSRYANTFVVAWDGDLLVHPDDVTRCLSHNGEFIGVSSSSTEDGVFVRTNQDNNVIGFSREHGDFEWSGPARIRRDRLNFVSGHVYTQLEGMLPLPYLKLRAQDIDTYTDYQNAIQFVQSWTAGNHRIQPYYARLATRITSPLDTRNKSKDFSDFDINFVKRYAGKHLDLLDLGAGTGLLVNAVANDFRSVTAVEKYQEFSAYIDKRESVKVINGDLQSLTLNRRFDVITIFGVMNFFNRSEAHHIYAQAKNWLKPGGLLLIKHQMGVEADVLVDGHSVELDDHYYSEYRCLESELSILAATGFNCREVVDIYPAEFNRWPNTHFYALVCD